MSDRDRSADGARPPGRRPLEASLDGEPRERTASLLRVSLLQFAPAWEDRAASRARVAALLEGARELGDWIVLPEMALSGFTMNRAAAAWDEADLSFFSSLASSLRRWITVGAVLGSRNLALAFEPGGSIAARYAKRHLFSPSGECGAYEAGDAAVVYAPGGMPVSQSICYDLRFPYCFWPEAASVAAFCVVAAWPAPRADHWRTLLRARAVENQAFVIGVNRVGSEPAADYSGDSAVIGPRGETLLDAGSAEGVFTTSFDPAASQAWRASFPALEDRIA